MTVCGAFSVSKSTVTPNGMAISSVRAYRLPMLPLALSTLHETAAAVSSRAGQRGGGRQRERWAQGDGTGAFQGLWGRVIVNVIMNAQKCGILMSKYSMLIIR